MSDPELAQAGRAGLLLSLAERDADVLIAELPQLRASLADGGVLALAATGATARLQAALEAIFPAVARFRQRPVAGSIFADERYAAARVTALADASAGDRPTCELFLCALGALPHIGPGLFEVDAAADIDRQPWPQPDAGRKPEQDDADADLPSRAQAASLVERLMRLDEVRVEGQFEIRALSDELGRLRSQRPSAVAHWFDFPRERHAWPLNDHTDLSIGDLGLYDHRCDDDLVETVRAGHAFVARFDLDGRAPHFAEAVRALNDDPRRIHVVPEDDRAEPDVSIVIPVYGQLGYTLNCLHAIFAQRSRSSVEVIVVDDRSIDETAAILPLLSGVHYVRQPKNAGFIAACNAGAARARGRFIVLLNNDTRVTSGWLDNLVESFDLFPKAGLVGSKLLYPDGTLQEAGGIIWRDGSAWNYGRHDDPNRPQYCHARQVDYVSGASIAIIASLWREIGGFDSYFAPAYCEDADLCFRIRASGHETWYQPTSRVIHFEGKTGGTDTAAGVKAYQVVNLPKFRFRHRETLLHHRVSGTAPFLERERAVTKRVLVIEPTAPTPNQDAGSVYTIMILRLLQDLGYKPYFVPSDNFLFQPQYTPVLQRMGIECAYAPYDTSMQEYLQLYGSLFDLVLVFRVGVLEKLVEMLREHVPNAPLLFNNHDLHYLRLQRGAELTGDADGLLTAAAMKARELATMARADCIISPSPYEVAVLADELPDVPAIALPIMAELNRTDVGFARRRDICFLGGYTHAPNVDAVVYFVSEVMPLIRAADPGIKFIIAGANPSDAVRALACDDVVVTGLIPDLRDLFDVVRVFVCPLRFGAGMKGKILQSMSYGVPVVSTQVGVEGIAAHPGEHVLVADTPDGIAEACLRVYRKPALWRKLSENGARLVQQRHSPDHGRRALGEAIEIGFRRLLGIDRSEGAPRQAEAAE